MKTKLLLSGLFLSTFFISNAQYNWDYGVKLGGANYLGEIGGKEKTRRNFLWDMRLNQSRLAVGGFVRYKINSFGSINAGLTYGRITANDANSSNPGRVGRNLSFKNDIIELSARGELNIYNIADVSRKGWYRVDFKSYIFAGVAGFYHSPKAKSDKYNSGKWTELQPLQTEGQYYSKFGASIPVGFGVYFTNRRHHRLGWEIGLSTTFTDYLDDVSGMYPEINEVDPLVYYAFTNRTDEVATEDLPLGEGENYQPGSKRGDSKHNDAYVFTTFSYSYVKRNSNSIYTNWNPKYSKKRRKLQFKF